MPKASVILETLDRLPTQQTCAEIAEFLADFVKNGGLADPLPGDESSEVWRERLTWWWHFNPFLKEGPPLAYLLRNEDDDGRIVGFHGFIAHDYESGGEIVPSLITTTFFVEEAFRTHSMKIVLKLNRLGREYQLLDGTPSPEMRAILDKFHFEKRSEVNRFNILVQRRGFSLFKSTLLDKLGLAKRMPAPLPGTCNDLQVVNDPGQIVSIPSRDDQKLHRCVTKEGLSWVLNAGSGERQFFGLVDGNGALQAFAIGFLKREKGITACRMLEYGAFDEDDSALIALMARISRHPDRCGLPHQVDVILWSVFEGTLKTLPNFDPEVRESILYFRVPSRWQGRTKTCLPCEGDLVLL